METKKIVLKFLGGAGIVRFIMLFLAFFAAVIYSELTATIYNLYNSTCKLKYVSGLVAQFLVNSEFESHELKEYLLNMDKSTWDFYDSFYFTMETVTTIGAGYEGIVMQWGGGGVTRFTAVESEEIFRNLVLENCPYNFNRLRV